MSTSVHKDQPLFDDVVFLSTALQTVLNENTDEPVRQTVAALLAGEAPQAVIERALPILDDAQL